MTQHQAVIIGGGLVGGLTALLLAEAGIQTTVLDASPLLVRERVLQEANPRVLAINQASIRLMQHAGFWQHLARHEPYCGMQVWNRDDIGEVVFGHSAPQRPMEHDWLGSMVEPSILNLAIQEQLQTKVNDYRTEVKVTRIEPCPHGWYVYLADGEVLQTALIIGADGANSFVRQQAMIELDILNYQQTALSCAIRTEKPHQYTARQIFLPTGPLALLPMHSLNAEENGYWQSIVWTVPSDLADEYHQLSDTDFRQQVAQASHYMLGDVTAVVSRAKFPLIARQAQHYVQPGLALVGDAAHVIHPLAGQGVNLGCLDAGVLVEQLIQSHQRGAWANLQYLRKYEHQRRPHNVAMMHSMSAIGWINRWQAKPLQWLRSEGTHFVANQPWLMDFFQQQAGGLSALKQTRYG